MYEEKEFEYRVKLILYAESGFEERPTKYIGGTNDKDILFPFS